VNPEEYLGIIFVLASGGFLNFIEDLADLDLRVGIKVQGYESDGSEGFVNTPNPVPKTATMLFFGSGLVGLVGFGKKFRKG